MKFLLFVLGYTSIKSQVTRSRRKQLPPNIITFDEIPNESKYYKKKKKKKKKKNKDEKFLL